MHSKKSLLTNFSRATFSSSSCIRPDNEMQLSDYLAQNLPGQLLTRGSGLSYNDSCFNTNGFIIDSKRLNHFIDFDSKNGIVLCQGGVPLKDLFLLHPDFIPPVLPGTVHATIAGSIAHDVHGKNNHHAGSFGHHLIAFDLLIGNKKIHCSRDENSDLFHATIAGLGLTGVITKAALQLKKASRYVQVEHQQFESVQNLIQYMKTEGIHHDYQVAWLDLLNPLQRSILSIASHCEPFHHKEPKFLTVPKLPFSLINSWSIKLFNHHFYNNKRTQEKLTLEQFNNPLDKLLHWNRLYGPRGLIQFQAVFDIDNATTTIDHLVQLIRTHKVSPVLSVLKLFSKSGDGLLSFCKPGFTLAIDFIHNTQAIEAIKAMNQLINELNGHVYLAKDMFLNEAQFKKMYAKRDQFSQTLQRYSCNMYSDIAKRLGIKK